MRQKRRAVSGTFRHGRKQLVKEARDVLAGVSGVVWPILLGNRTLSWIPKIRRRRRRTCRLSRSLQAVRRAV